MIIYEVRFLYGWNEKDFIGVFSSRDYAKRETQSYFERLGHNRRRKLLWKEYGDQSVCKAGGGGYYIIPLEVEIDPLQPFDESIMKHIDKE